MLLRPVTVLAVLALIAPSALDAQVRPDRSRQLRAASPCGAPECHYGTRLLDEPPQTTAIAGVSGEASETLELPGAAPIGFFSSNAIKRLELGERGDEPCFLSITTGDDTASWSRCGNDASTLKVASNDSPDVIIGLQICTNGRNGPRGRLVKGIRVRWARKPHETSASDQDRLEGQIRQPNCSDWGPWVQCPAGTASRGLVLHHDAVGGRRALVGLQLRCLPADPWCFDADDDVWGTYSPPMRSCRASD